MRFFFRVLVVVGSVSLAACGGGGGGVSSGGGMTPGVGAPSATPMSSPTAPPTPVPIGLSTPTQQGSTMVAGTVTLIPDDAYGPTVIGGTTYVSADAMQTTPLANAKVIVGPVAVMGATPPPILPAGDVVVTTNAAGAFSATVTIAPAAPSVGADFGNVPLDVFVIPTNNVTNFTPPATGYYVEVFGAGSDGKSAAMAIPLHRFLAPSTSLGLRITTPTVAEAGALAAVNADRASNTGAGPLIFDESAQEAARLHAADEAQNSYGACHYDLNNAGPMSRYLNVGGIGLTGEGVGGPFGSSTTAATAFSQTESAFVAEKNESPPGGHYEDIIDTSHIWAGLAAMSASSTVQVDYELVTSPGSTDSVVGASGYTAASCPVGITDNNS